MSEGEPGMSWLCRAALMPHVSDTAEPRGTRPAHSFPQTQRLPKQLLSVLLGFPAWKLNLCPPLWLLPASGATSVGTLGGMELDHGCTLCRAPQGTEASEAEGASSTWPWALEGCPESSALHPQALCRSPDSLFLPMAGPGMVAPGVTPSPQLPPCAMCDM